MFKTAKNFIHSWCNSKHLYYEPGASGSNNSDPTLKNCLFNAVTLTKSADIDKYEYSGYRIRFNRKSSFSFPGGGMGQNVVIFGADIISSVHINNRKKDMLVLGKGRTHGLEHTPTAEKMYSINFTVIKKKFCLSLHHNGANSYLFVNIQKLTNLKQRNLKLLQVHYV